MPCLCGCTFAALLLHLCCTFCSVATREGLEQGYCVVAADKRFLLLFTFLKKNLNKKVGSLVRTALPHTLVAFFMRIPSWHFLCAYPRGIFYTQHAQPCCQSLVALALQGTCWVTFIQPCLCEAPPLSSQCMHARSPPVCVCVRVRACLLVACTPSFPM